MQSFRKILGAATLALVIGGALSACQPKAELVKPTADQQASLERLRVNCIAASPGKEGKMRNLAELRNRQQTFTCDEMKALCETDYAGKMCQGMMTVAAVENAHQKACRKSAAASRSSACQKLAPCNGKGFTSPECTAVIARFNR